MKFPQKHLWYLQRCTNLHYLYMYQIIIRCHVTNDIVISIRFQDPSITHPSFISRQNNIFYHEWSMCSIIIICSLPLHFKPAHSQTSSISSLNYIALWSMCSHIIICFLECDKCSTNDTHTHSLTHALTHSLIKEWIITKFKSKDNTHNCL